jgi:hypothetical protein
VTPPTNKCRSPRLSDAQLFVLQLLFTCQHHHGNDGATLADLGDPQRATIGVLLERGLIESWPARMISGNLRPGYRLTALGRQVLEREDRAI